MTEFQVDGRTVTPLTDSAHERSLRRLTHVLYVLYAVSGPTGGLTALVALIFNYVRRSETDGTIYRSHFDWQIRTFWISLCAFVAGFVLQIIFIGFVIMWGAAIWTLYRIIKGWLYLHDGKPLPVRRKGRAAATAP